MFSCIEPIKIADFVFACVEEQNQRIIAEADGPTVEGLPYGLKAFYFAKACATLQCPDIKHLVVRLYSPDGAESRLMLDETGALVSIDSSPRIVSGTSMVAQTYKSYSASIAKLASRIRSRWPNAKMQVLEYSIQASILGKNIALRNGQWEFVQIFVFAVPLQKNTQVHIVIDGQYASSTLLGKAPSLASFSSMEPKYSAELQLLLKELLL